MKRYDLPSALPEAAEDFSSVPAGQLVLEGTGGLRLFYQESPAGGSYTPLATLRETEGTCPGLGGGERGGDAPAGDRVKKSVLPLDL